MEYMSLIPVVIGAHFLALISPGPDFILVVRSACRNTRRRALGVALGIALANGLYIALCIIGIGAVLAHSLPLMIALKILGALFLLYIAFHALRARREDYAFVQETAAGGRGVSFARECMLGIASGLSNPKNILFYLSLFTVVLTPESPLLLKIALGVWMTGLVFLWDAMIIYVLSQRRVRAQFGKIAFYIDKAAGALLGLMGIKLLHSAVKTG